MAYKKEINVGMIFKKHYCRKCGERLIKNPIRSVFQRGDPEYYKHNRMGRGRILDKTIHVTEYNYKCPSCGSIVEYDDQLEIEQVQKKMKSRTLSDMELVSEREWAQKRVSRNKKITFAISLSVSALFIISIILLANGV